MLNQFNYIESNIIFLGVCISGAGLYGHLDDSTMLNWFIEWIETNRLVGVTHFYLSNTSASMDAGVKRMFDYYANKGIVRISQHPPPMRDMSKPIPGGKATDKLNMDRVPYIPSHNARIDCMYHNMYRHRFIVLIDIDEIIIRENDGVDTLTQMLSNVYALPAKDGAEPPSISIRSRAPPSVLKNTVFAQMKSRNVDKSILNPHKCLLWSMEIGSARKSDKAQEI